MRNTLDFSSWQGVLSTLLGLVLVSVVAVGIRLLVMQSVQQRRERQNRQINERLKTLIAAYKTLGGSFTGDLAVDPSHLRERRQQARVAAAAVADAGLDAVVGADPPPADAADGIAAADAPGATGSDRRRRIRDAVEAALSDVILLGTREQVRLAVQAANDMVAGRAIETADLVASLRAFIREVLDLEAIPADLPIPRQGPVRVAGSGARGGPAARASGAGGGRGRQGGGGGDGGTAGVGAVGVVPGGGTSRAGGAGADLAVAEHPGST